MLLYYHDSTVVFNCQEKKLTKSFLQQYLGVYQACTEQDAIGYLDYRELSDCFEIIRNSTRSLYEMYMLNMPHFSREYNQDQLFEVKNQFLQQFDLHEGERAYIKPKLTYEMTVDTTYAASEDIALHILERFAGDETNRF